jgi:predicted P-loop ATPase
MLPLVAAVRRIRRPGTKFDTILVLEGPQGSGKSTAVKILASEEWFSDAEVLAADPKTQAEALEGVLIFELGELSGIHRSEVEKVKAFASRTVDKSRPAYARYREDHPRQNVFIGTTNDDAYLKDATGNRRFWPVLTGSSIDLEGLAMDRDQLWAEAVHLEATGMSLMLPEGLWATAAEAQTERTMTDPWEEYLGSLVGGIEAGVERVGSSQVLTHLGVPAERQTGFMLKRLAPIMQKLGWTGPKSIRINKRVVKGYERPTDESDSALF